MGKSKWKATSGSVARWAIFEKGIEDYKRQMLEGEWWYNMTPESLAAKVVTKKEKRRAAIDECIKKMEMEKRKKIEENMKKMKSEAKQKPQTKARPPKVDAAAKKAAANKTTPKAAPVTAATPNKEVLPAKPKVPEQQAKATPPAKMEKEQPKQQKTKGGQQPPKKESKENAAKEVGKPAEEKIEGAKMPKMEDNVTKITPQKILLPTIPQIPSDKMQAFTGERVPIPKDNVAPPPPQLKEATSFPTSPKDTKQPFIPKQTAPASPKPSQESADKNAKMVASQTKDDKSPLVAPKVETKDKNTDAKQDSGNIIAPPLQNKDNRKDTPDTTNQKGNVSSGKNDQKKGQAEVKQETPIKSGKSAPSKETIPGIKPEISKEPIPTQGNIPQGQQQQPTKSQATQEASTKLKDNNQQQPAKPQATQEASTKLKDSNKQQPAKPQAIQEASTKSKDKIQLESKAAITPIQSTKPTDNIDPPKIDLPQTEGMKPAHENKNQTEPTADKKSIFEVLTSNVKTVLPKILGTQNKSSAKGQPQVQPDCGSVDTNTSKPIDTSSADLNVCSKTKLDQSTEKDRVEKPAIVPGPKVDKGKTAQVIPQQSPVDVLSDKGNQAKIQEEKSAQQTGAKEHQKLTISEKRQRRKTKSGEKEQQHEKPASPQPAKMPTQQKEIPKSEVQQTTEKITPEIATKPSMQTQSKDKSVPPPPTNDNIQPKTPITPPQDKETVKTISQDKQVSKSTDKSNQDKQIPKNSEIIPPQVKEVPILPAKINQQEVNAPKIPKEMPIPSSKESKLPTETTQQEKEITKPTTEASKQNKNVPKIPLEAAKKENDVQKSPAAIIQEKEVIMPDTNSKNKATHADENIKEKSTGKLSTEKTTKEKESPVPASKGTSQQDKEKQKSKEKIPLQKEMDKHSQPVDIPKKADEVQKTQVTALQKDKSAPQPIEKALQSDKEMHKLPAKSPVQDKGFPKPGQEAKEKRQEPPLNQRNISEPAIQSKTQDKSQTKGAQDNKKQNVKDMDSVKPHLKSQNKSEPKTKIPKQQKNQGDNKLADKPVSQQADNKEIKSPAKPSNNEAIPSSQLPDMKVQDKQKIPDPLPQTVDKKAEQAKADPALEKASVAKAQAKGKRVRQRSKRESESDKEKISQLTKEPTKSPIPPVQQTGAWAVPHGFAAAAKKSPIAEPGKDKITETDKSSTQNIRLAPEMQPPKEPSPQPKREIDNSKVSEPLISFEQRMQATQVMNRNQQVSQGSPTLRSGAFPSETLGQPPAGFKAEPPVIPMRQGVSTLSSSTPPFIPTGQGTIPTQPPPSQITFGTPMSPPITGQAIPPQYQQGPNTTQFKQGQNTTQYQQGPNPTQYQQGPNPAQYQPDRNPMQMSFPRGIPPTQFSPGQGLSSYFQPGQDGQQPFAPERFGPPSPMGRGMGGHLPRGPRMPPNTTQQSTFLTQVDPDEDLQVPDLFDNFM